MMPQAASLARYQAFAVDQLNFSSRQFTPDSSVSTSSNSSTNSTPAFDLPSLLGDSAFLPSEFQRNLAQFTSQLTMTGQNELLAANGSAAQESNTLQYSDEQLINSSNKKLSFSIDSLVNGKQSALNKHAVAAVAAMSAFKGLNGTANLTNLTNLNSIKESEALSVQNLSHLNHLGSAVAAAFALHNRNGSNLPKSQPKDDLRGSISPNSPCSSASSVCSDHNQKQQQQSQNNNSNNNNSSSQPGNQQNRTSANNSPRPTSAASQHSNSASQLLNVASLQNSYRDNEGSSLAGSSKPLDKQALLKQERCRSPQTATNRSSTSPSFINSNTHNNLSIKSEPSPNLPPDAALLQHLQQQQLRQQIQQQLQQVNCPDSALLQHIQQQQLRQLQNAQQNSQTPLQSASPHGGIPQPQQQAVHQPPPQANSAPQQTTSTGPPPNFNNSNNTAAALLNQLRANSLNGANPAAAAAAALNPLNGLNLPNPAALASQQPNLPNLPALNQLAGLNPAAAASMNSPLNSLVPGLNPLSPPRPPSLADYSSYYSYLAMTRPNYYPLGRFDLSIPKGLRNLFLIISELLFEALD